MERPHITSSGRSEKGCQSDDGVKKRISKLLVKEYVKEI